MKWERKPLTDFVWFQRGFDLPKDKFVNGEFPVVGSTSILGYHTEAKVKAPGIVTGRSGTIGQFQFMKNDFWPHNTSLWVKDFYGNDERFAFYLLHTLDFISLNGGGAVPSLNRNFLSSINVNVPPLPTQRKIASILSAYDDLIENNLKRIKLLEEKARIEYKSIQKNEKLEFKKAVEVLQFSTGKLNSNAAVPNGQYPFFTCGQEILRTNTFSLDEEVVLLGGNNASAIYPVFYYKGKFDAYQRTYIIKPKLEVNISFKYLFYFWESKLDYLKNISTGAATKFLTLKILNDIDIPLPSKKVIEEYELLTAPIFKLKAILVEQNTKLREARDILLPKLMNGQIEV
jgi:type I restriction enzyme S subunit